MNCKNDVIHAMENAKETGVINATAIGLNDKEELRLATKTFNGLLDEANKSDNKADKGLLVKMFTSSMLGKQYPSESLFKLKCRVMGMVQSSQSRGKLGEELGLNDDDVKQMQSIYLGEMQRRSKEYVKNRFGVSKVVSNVSVLTTEEDVEGDDSYVALNSEGEFVFAPEKTGSGIVQLDDSIIGLIHIKD